MIGQCESAIEYDANRRSNTMRFCSLGVDTYTLLEEMASRVPAGAWGVMPIFSDRMRFKSWYHAAPSFLNLSIDPEKCNKATLFRALEENAAIVSTCNLSQIADFTGIHPSS